MLEQILDFALKAPWTAFFLGVIVLFMITIPFEFLFKMYNRRLRSRNQEAFVEEISTGRKCENKSDMLEMYDEAYDIMVKGKTGKPSGRPRKHIYTQEQMKDMLDTWNKTIGTVADKFIMVQKFYPDMKLSQFYKIKETLKEQGIE